MRHAVLPFALATLAPVPLLIAGGMAGGAWIWTAVLLTSVLAFAADEVIAAASAEGSAEGTARTADLLSAALGVIHLALVPLGVAALSGATGLAPVDRVGVFLAFGLYFGQISNSNAHELIHRSRRWLFELGKWVYISMAYGHHTTAHRLLHHAHAATPEDPNYPRKGESFYRYFRRGWIGSFVKGHAVERARLQRQAARAAGGPRTAGGLRTAEGPTVGGRRRVNPYVVYVGGAVVIGVAFWIWLGWAGLAAWIVLSFYAQTQLAMVDYLQHYGLARRKLPSGGYEPQGLHHSWNSPHWYSSQMMVNASRHSDHHAHPGRPFPALRLPSGVPMLPYSLPAMGIVALWPGLWFQMMDKRVDAVRAAAPAPDAAPAQRAGAA